jgi:hypothetical protein
MKDKNAKPAMLKRGTNGRGRVKEGSKEGEHGITIFIQE